MFQFDDRPSASSWPGCTWSLAVSQKQQKPLAVIKVGGDVLLDENERLGLAANVCELHAIGWDIVILHGGGPQVTDLQNRLGLKSLKVAGRRITSKADLQVVKQAIAGGVNVDLVALLTHSGLPVFGCHGASGLLIEATKRPAIKVSGEGESLIDFGEVGDVVSINHQLLQGLLDLGQIPVIATLGIDKKGHVFNINADTTVVQICKTLKADLLLLITQVGGIYEDLDNPDSLLTDIDPQQARALIKQGIIKDGMIPKVEEAISLLDFGTKTIAITAASRTGVFKALASAGSEQKKIQATRIYHRN